MQNDSHEEIIIIERVFEGETQAYRILAEGYLPKLQRFLGSLLKDHSTTEDVCQDALIRAYRNLQKIDPFRSQFKTWLYTIAKRLALQSLKKHRPTPVETLPERVDHSRPHSLNFNQNIL